ncbi:MAG: hypothetical protein AB7S49_03975 [Arcobacter sp.]|jgi:hypothetical protein|uniref:hypothetical protein n=1 Tax=Arcobacter sp. TaxID=1872629 RepID=UPI003CFD1C24
MIDDLKNILVSIVVSLIVILSYNKFINKDTKNEEILVFSAKDIIEHKKLQIKKAILNNEDTTNKEKELEDLIRITDLLLEDFSNINNKPIYQKEAILRGNTRDITPLIEKALEKKGLL